MQCTKTIGRFTGELDIETLGGAGFASQRSTGEDRVWDLSEYAGILLDVTEADGKSSCSSQLAYISWCPKQYPCKKRKSRPLDGA